MGNKKKAKHQHVAHHSDEDRVRALGWALQNASLWNSKAVEAINAGRVWDAARSAQEELEWLLIADHLSEGAQEATSRPKNITVPVLIVERERAWSDGCRVTH